MTKRVARDDAAMGRASANKSPAARVRPSASGYGLASAAGTGADACPGCRHAPHRACAACGAPRGIVLDAGEHGLPLCAACFALLVEVAAPDRADELKHEWEQRQLRRRRRPVARQHTEGEEGAA
jgi:hypothetical protein